MTADSYGGALSITGTADARESSAGLQLAAELNASEVEVRDLLRDLADAARSLTDDPPGAVVVIEIEVDPVNFGCGHRRIADMLAGEDLRKRPQEIQTPQRSHADDVEQSIAGVRFGGHHHLAAGEAAVVERQEGQRRAILGLVLLAGCGAVALSGVDLGHFWTALVLLGLGWNFAFVGATALVTDCYRPAERNKIQAVNDLAVFATVAFASYSSGHLLNRIGWDAVATSLFPFVVLALILIGWLMWSAKRPATA